MAAVYLIRPGAYPKNSPSLGSGQEETRTVPLGEWAGLSARGAAASPAQQAIDFTGGGVWGNRGKASLSARPGSHSLGSWILLTD